MTALKPPSPDSVLYVIYQRDGNGAVSYQIDGGVTVSYWHGQSFVLKGKQYFTGFATSTEGEPGPDSEAGLMEPGHVAIAQATFVQGEEAGKPVWSPLDTDGYIGEFGANDQPDAFDGTRQVQSHEVGDGRLLLAVPTRRFAQGVDTSAYALFLFDPDNVDTLSFRRWGYVGSVDSGSDNAAACDGGAVMPCATSTGMLSFGNAPTAGGLPTVTVALSGQEASGPGQVRTLAAADALSYTFDADKGHYHR